MAVSGRKIAIRGHDGDEPADQLLYAEYVRGFDEIPVLEEAISIPQRRPPPPSFVHGERSSQRKSERPDGYSLREARVAELERLYGEYLAPQTVRSKFKQARSNKGRSRKRRRTKR